MYALISYETKEIPELACGLWNLYQAPGKHRGELSFNRGQCITWPNDDTPHGHDHAPLSFDGLNKVKHYFNWLV